MSSQAPEFQKGRVFEVFFAFLKLGLTSFGGPVAHLAFFRTEFVQRRRWLSDASYSDLVALCQFLPGPASSQVGMALGLGRAGGWGALAAWVGFTLPSALALMFLAQGLTHEAALAQSGALHGLKLVTVAVVAQAVWGMSRSLCPDRQRGAMALGAAAVVLLLPSAFAPMVAIALGALLGWRFVTLPQLPAAAHIRFGISRRTGTLLLMAFGILLLGLSLWAAHSEIMLVQVVADFYRAGALVFGGGHVVLPLLQSSVVPAGWMDNNTFLAGYGAAQAVPGPLFSFASFVGAAMPAPLGGWLVGVVLLLAIFLPAFLLLAGALPFWESLRQHQGVQRAVAGINATVVGVLGAAFYDPILRSAVHTPWDVAWVLLAYGLLVFGRVSPVIVVGLAALSGAVFSVGP